MGVIKVSLDGLEGCAMQFHTISITLEDLKSSMDNVFCSVDSKIKRRRNIDGSIADIQKSMKALYTEIENIRLFISSSKNIYEKMELRLEKESNNFINRMEDIAELKKEWYQENWFKIAVGVVVTGIAIAAVVIAGPELMIIAVGTVVGGGICGITEGIESTQNGGEFIDGFSDGFMKGTIETFLAEIVGCAGVGVGAKLFAGGTINSFSYTVSTQLNGGTVAAPDLAVEFAKGVGAIAAGEVVFAGLAKYAARGIPEYELNGARAVENPKIIEKEAKEVIEGGSNTIEDAVDAGLDSKLVPASNEIKITLEKGGLTQQKIDEIVSLPKGKKPLPETYLCKEYITNHIQSFKESGVVKIMPSEPSGTIGGRGGTFVMSADELDGIIKSTDGDIAKIESALGFDPGYLGENPVIVKFDSASGLRMPQGNELGAYPEYWIPGGYTSGGIKEAVIDPAKEGTYSFKHILIKGENYEKNFGR